jgi:hypothetical protein
MTCVIAWLEKSGAGFVADKRIIRDSGITTDVFVKVIQVAPALVLSFAGELGPVQHWVRHAKRHKVRTVDQLLHEQPPGAYEYLLYDAERHELSHGDGDACAMPVTTDYAVIGSGAEFTRGYTAAAGWPDDTASRSVLATCCIEQCSLTNISVSREVDALFVSRDAVATRTKKASKSRPNARRGASRRPTR